MRTTATLFALSLLTACASPPVWRAAQYGPTTPTPTLAAASVCGFTIPEPEAVTIDATDANFSFSDLAKGIGNFVKDNPDVIANLAAEAALKSVARQEAADAIGAVALGMHKDAMAFLTSQGFPIETDGSRARQLVGNGTAAGEFCWVAPETAARPFANFPMFGPGSKSSIVERLKTARPREAFASVHADFQAEDNRIDKTVTCTLRIVVIDQAGVQVFEGNTVGSAKPTGSAKKTVQAAFTAALQGMAKPVIQS